LKKCSRILLGDGSIVPVTDQLRKELNEHIDEMAGKALRCIGHAYKDNSDLFSDYDGLDHPSHHHLTDTNRYAEFENDAVFVGLVAMRDPPRPEVPFSIEVCKMAGIRVCMITGDN
jgi:magnesium-transporting ATPase (P-type)